MGCSFCRGHAGQVCSHPDCRDETAEVERYMQSEREQARLWKPLSQHVCGVCREPAAFSHPTQGFRCGVHVPKVY